MFLKFLFNILLKIFFRLQSLFKIISSKANQENGKLYIYTKC